MAKITINEVSQNYTYNVGSNSFATVALPITSSWGPGFFDVSAMGSHITEADMLETLSWSRFPATQAGLESFVSTYRGPAANYRLAKDYSYQMAMTLITAGYDVLVCRLCPGACSRVNLETGKFETASSKYIKSGTGKLAITAKYPGTFGNNLRVVLKKVPNRNYWNLITYVIDAAQVKTAVENLTFTFDLNDSDVIPYIDEVESDFLTLVYTGVVGDGEEFVNVSSDKDGKEFIYAASENLIALSGGTDKGTGLSDVLVELTEAPADWNDTYTQYFVKNDSKFNHVPKGDAAPNFEASKYYGFSADAEYVLNLVKARYGDLNGEYAKTLSDALINAEDDSAKLSTLKYNEWLYTKSLSVYDLLTDKLSYNPQRVISPGWDDQDISALTGEPFNQRLNELSPLHKKLMAVAYNSRCATALIDIPKSLPRSEVYNESTDTNVEGYAQKLARYVPNDTLFDTNVSLFTSHSALVAPWGTYTYAGMSKKLDASPAFLALMIQRAMILNQATQYEWALPTNRKHTLKIGKLAYVVGKKLLDQWQKLEGVGVNILTNIPDLGTTLWGNSTLYEVPAATYQALSNLSTRYLVNAIEDLAYRCGIQITFQYNNDQAYSAFHAGMTPLLDTMKNVGAIDDYYIRMSADINGVDHVNANTVIAKVYLVINGVINDIVVDLIALPAGTDLSQFEA